MDIRLGVAKMKKKRLNESIPRHVKKRWIAFGDLCNFDERDGRGSMDRKTCQLQAPSSKVGERTDNVSLERSYFVVVNKRQIMRRRRR